MRLRIVKAINTLIERKGLKNKVQSVLFGFVDQGKPLKPLQYKQMGILYTSNVYRPDTVYKVWNVAVKSVQPDERFAEHASWMLHIIAMRNYTIGCIAAHEHNETCATYRAYKQALITTDFKTVKVE